MSYRFISDSSASPRETHRTLFETEFSSSVVTYISNQIPHSLHHTSLKSVSLSHKAQGVPFSVLFTSNSSSKEEFRLSDAEICTAGITPSFTPPRVAKTRVGSIML